MKEHFVDIDGLKTYYLEGKRKSGPVVVLLHGWGLSSEAFQSSLEQLSTRYHVFAPDLPNFGKTTWKDHFGEYAHYAQFLVHFLDEMGFDKVNLIGQSMGGAISAVTAALYPDRVQTLVLANSAGIPVPKYKQLAFRRATEFAAQFVHTEFGVENVHMMSAFMRHILKQRSSMLSSLQLPVSKDIRPLLHRIEAPCLLAWGARDGLFPLSYARQFAERIPNCELITIEHGYHEWSLMYPKELLRVVNDFYTKHGVAS